MGKKRGEPKMITTTVRVEAGTLTDPNIAAKSIGMGQSDFIRFAIMVMISRTERGFL